MNQHQLHGAATQVILGTGQQASHVLRLMEWMGWPAKMCSFSMIPIRQGTRNGREERLSAIVVLGSRVARVRYPTFRKAIDAAVALCSFINPSYVIAPSKKIGVNALFMPRCVFSPGPTVGSQCSLFSNVRVEDDCQIGDNVMMRPGVGLSGSVAEPRWEG